MKGKKTLKVNKGVEAPDVLNEALLNNIRLRKIKLMPASYYVSGILKGQINILSQAITIIESTLTEHRHLADILIEQCLPHAGKSLRIGITGVPGVGKSTFIEALGKHIISRKHKLAVLAVDPSSSRTKGSILGDKTRMEDLSTLPEAFIRPSPSGGNLGGVARKTRETIILCEAAGFDVIFIETVGVGQSETTVKDMVDFFLLLMLAGAGDELQGIKRGIMEMADMVVVNKADGNNYENALRAKAEYANALHLFPAQPSGWKIPVEISSALTKFGIDKVWENIEAYLKLTQNNGFFESNRINQQKKCFNDTIINELHQKLFNDKQTALLFKELENQLIQKKLSPYKAANQIIESFLKRNKDA